MLCRRRRGRKAIRQMPVLNSAVQMLNRTLKTNEPT
jgi:hypothetical protein